VSPMSVPAALVPSSNLTTSIPASPMPGDTASSGLYYNGSTTPTPTSGAGGSSSALWLVAAAGLLFLFAPRGH
jgi:phytoene dehydrogenase-like protein